ncbi:unnamed protein product [Scytosiphon promiscuus]
MSGTACPFASQWRQRSTAEAIVPTSSATARRGGTNTGSTASALASRTPASSCPVAVCPLGFGRAADSRPSAATFARSGLPRMPLTVLAGHATLVAVKGVIFEVSPDEALARLAGHDVSRLVAVSTDAGGGDLDAGLEGLRYEEHQRLEACFLEMARAGRAVAVLTDEDYTRIFGTPLSAGPNDDFSTSAATPATINANGYGGGHEAADTPCPPALAAELHALVERDDAEAVSRLLSEHRQDVSHSATEDEYGARRIGVLVDCTCPRTGMTPLLKAVEGDSEGVVRVLLGAGADVRSQAALYDDDDALALAERLSCSDSIVEMIQRASPHRT